MLKSIDILATFRNKISFQCFSHFLISSMVLFVIGFVYLLCICPIQVKQYNAILQLAHSAQYPKTQQLANQVLQQSDLKQWQYFHVIRAYQYEQFMMTQYPALDLDDTPQRF